MDSAEVKARSYGSLLAGCVIFFSEFSDHRSGNPVDSEWVARARELRGRILHELGEGGLKKNQKKG